MRLVRHADLVPRPWKNGGGVTRELACSPPGAGTDGFDWRLSMAEVAGDGPFSAFPGVDRTLILLEGAGLRLAVADAPEVTLTPGAMLRFGGEVPVMARLVAGAVRDLNVMVRRDRWRAGVDNLSITGAAPLPCEGNGPVAAVLRSGRVTMTDGTALLPGDALLSMGGRWTDLMLRGTGEIILVRLQAI